MDTEHIDTEMIKLEVNLDDISGEWLGYVMELLFNAGARDVYYSPIFMKKNRPGYLMQILCELNDLNKMKSILFRETTTLGVRYYPLSVHRLERSFFKIPSPWGEITVKEGSYKGTVVQQAPEYEDCRLIAKSQEVPIKEIYQYVWSYLNQKDK
ncbi:nickel insertion protein [Alteribacter natronophilus]|uniref:nickel insertion protein n=1 Tax=Alteribacter natronophilus TaxID=2583810 RepID=UPI00110F665B|nr:nickel insertion protein [Alteribacter natronophilus]TMW72269.1 LarC family nickel insertion protein [Alteribacter natronophilus]